jgi:hypothetical protein
MGGGVTMPNSRQRAAQRYRYNMKYKARRKALAPAAMSAKARAENRIKALLEEEE